jgi:hypothetical protein
MPVIRLFVNGDDHPLCAALSLDLLAVDNNGQGDYAMYHSNQTVNGKKIQIEKFALDSVNVRKRSMVVAGTAVTIEQLSSTSGVDADIDVTLSPV